MPTPFPLAPASDADSLAGLLNDQELSLGRQVLSVGGITTGNTAERINSVTIEFNIDADKLKRLSVAVVPEGATQAEATAAGSPEAAQNIKRAFSTFIAPMLHTAELLDRSEVFLKSDKVEIVLLRETGPVAATGNV